MVSSRFTFYPLFRLSVALATGIFLSDVFALDGTYLYALCFVFVLSVLLSSIFYFSKTYRIRFLFAKQSKKKENTKSDSGKKEQSASDGTKKDNIRGGI